MFVRTHNELQKVLDEIGYLSRSDLALDQYLGQLLPLVFNAIGGQGGAVWMPQDSGFQRMYAVRFPESGYDADEVQRQSIQQAVRDVAQHGRPLVVVGQVADAPGVIRTDPQATNIVNRTQFPFFYIPILLQEGAGRGLTLAVLHIWVSPQVDPKTYKEVVAFLQGAAKHASVYLRVRRAEMLGATTEKLQQLLRMATELNGQWNGPALAIAIVNWTRELTGCDRCAVFGFNGTGKLKALAVSSVEVVDPKSALVQAQRELAEDSLAAGTPTLYRKDAVKSEAQGTIADYFFHSQANEALAIPLTGREGKKGGVLLLESHKGKAIEPATQQLGMAIAGQVGRALVAVQEVESIPGLGWMKRLQRTRAALRAHRRSWYWLKIGIPLLLLIGLAGWPGRFTVGGECGVMPRDRAVAVAEVSGRVVEVYVNEGQVVKQGQALARVDDSEEQQALRVEEQEKAKYEAEADRLQVLNEDGGRRAARLQAEQVEREIEQWRRKLEKCTITSPMNGVVMTKDLPSHVGELLPVGGRFCEVADVSHWELQVHVSESDVGVLDEQLRHGGSLPAEFLLRSMPQQKMPAIIKDRNAISQMSYQIPRANVFLVRAELELPAWYQAELKAGYTGECKIVLGHRPLGYLLMRRFVDYLRVHWLF